MSKFFNKTSRLAVLAIGVLIATLSLVFAFNNGVAAYAMDGDTQVICGATIDDNFEDNTVIVIVDPNIAKLNKLHNAKAFDGIEIDSIIELTSREKKVNHGQKNEFSQTVKIELQEHSKENVLAAIAFLEKMEGVFCAEPNYLYGVEIVPNDPNYTSNLLWGLNGTNGIKMPDAWGIARGSNSIRVGVIDTGIATHPDLDANLVSGWDTFHNNSTTTDDTHSHGTHVAGTIGAVGNNSTGVVGVNWSVSLVPLQAANASNTFSSTDVVAAIKWAEDRCGTADQVHVINYSVGGFGTSTAVRTEVGKYCGLFVWTAGNEETNIDTRISSNGSFNLANLISVGALKSNGERPGVADWGYTSTGSPQGSNYSANGTNVHIYAPGDGIRSTVLSNGYGSKSGTSMAAPHVAGVAGLMLSVNPNMMGITGNTLGARLKTALTASANTVTITIPNGSGTITQSVKKLNAAEAVYYAAFQTSNGGNTIAVRNGVTLRGEVVLPSTDGTTITTIAASAFANCTQLSQISIPASVKNIGNYAFQNCTELMGVTFGQNSQMASIGDSAFSGCTGLTGITIPANLTSIGNSAFSSCTGLTEITIPSSVTSIGSSAFSGCNRLKSMTIPFAGASRAATGYGTRFGYIFGTSSYEGGVSTNQFGITYYIPATLNKLNITGNISFYAFYRCTGLTDITIGNGVTEIMDYAFYGCTGLTRITIGNGVEDICGSAFDGCVGLTSVTIPDSVTVIGADAFARCTGLIKVVVPDSVRLIGMSAFHGCSHLQEITLPFVGNAINSGSNNHFGYIFGASDQFNQGNYLPSSLKEVTISRSLPSSKYIMANPAFYTCIGLERITVSGNVEIGFAAFVFCSGLKSVRVGSGVTAIGDNAFAHCSSLQTVSISQSVTTIGNNAFAYCASLIDITIPSSVESIGTYAFENCTSLETVIMKRTAPNITSLGADAFDGCNSLIRIIVDENSLTEYGSAADWSEYAQLIIGDMDLLYGNQAVFYPNTDNSAAVEALSDAVIGTGHGQSNLLFYFSIRYLDGNEVSGSFSYGLITNANMGSVIAIIYGGTINQGDIKFSVIREIILRAPSYSPLEYDFYTDFYVYDSNIEFFAITGIIELQGQ